MPRPSVTCLSARPLDGGGSWIVVPEDSGSVAEDLGWKNVGTGEAVDVRVRAARARREYIEGMLGEVYGSVACVGDMCWPNTKETLYK